MKAQSISAIARHICSFVLVSVLSFYHLQARAGSPNNGASSKVDFNREIRPILAENCFKCHGPDEGGRKAKLRFDLRTEALKPAKSGKVAIVPGQPEKSEMIARLITEDEDERMPPVKTGKKLTLAQIQTLKRWITQDAPYATHWAYVKPVRPALPQVKNKGWPVNPIDYFILARLERENLKPSPRADPNTLIRRVTLDLTGLPPTLEEVDQFSKDRDPQAYEKLVDHLLQKKAYGEHWARMWLDLARYADSAGYADDPGRTIWAYRDWVIRAFNSNLPFDQFTVEQLAGDLLDSPDEDDRIATAFHRNTMTNNEGGTTDEEFRNAAIVDRVNTTMAVWMATSLGCAQCHNHKYDPITQKDYFQCFAIFNNTEDADLRDESPLLEIYTPEQKERRTKIQAELTESEKALKTPTAESPAHQIKWEENFPGERPWQSLKPEMQKASSGGIIVQSEDNSLQVSPSQKDEVYSIEAIPKGKQIAGLRLEALSSLPSHEAAQAANRGFAITRVTASLIGPNTNGIPGRFVRVELPGKEKILSLAEVQVFNGKENVAAHGAASQSSTAYEGVAGRAIDGKTDGDYNANSTTHTETSENPWWELDLKQTQTLDRIAIWNRTDADLHKRLDGFRLVILDENRKSVWDKMIKEAPKTSATFGVSDSNAVQFVAAFADMNPAGSNTKTILEGKKPGWALDPDDKQWRKLTLLPAQPVPVLPGSKLLITVKQEALHDHCPPALLRIKVAEDEEVSQYASVPEDIAQTLSEPSSSRDEKQRNALADYYLANVEPDLKTQRERVAALKKELSGISANTVPIMRELTGTKRRTTHIQLRGNYQALGEEVSPALPASFNPLPNGAKADRLGLARWLVDEQNPLTARVLANRFWEQIFGVGIVRTSEDFGTQGDLPTHPELLDWLATELVANKWDMKAFLKLLVTSSTYCQSSRVTPELAERDPDDILLARGPRFRASAEVVRDQALAISGLLSTKMYGPPVRPPQPSLGLSAAFGSTFDWKASEGEDRYRRALYVEWRRTSPYASMSTFDAPNREVCALRRPRSNTPLQALVTLNDPVYIEAAQALAERMISKPGAPAEKARQGFRLCLARTPEADELKQLLDLYNDAHTHYAAKPEEAAKIASSALHPAKDQDVIELAAWTAAANVLLNLDETLMKP
jgi:hypothetical protein